MGKPVNPFTEVPPPQVADYLVEIAARLRVVDPVHMVWGSMFLHPKGLRVGAEGEAAAVGAVDAHAAALGVPAATGKEHGTWKHGVSRNWDGFGIDVNTRVAGPRVCACGATCTHPLTVGVGVGG
ncbi:hypothetical protein GCM10010123_44240 [Pilimelia anulata]|uniref:Uncharacterized protein n=1 Tax=Pilimelia anulata TaxID=53371 RepID=A0A8J3FCQ7_9ACTN|nr:hypothetical protein [Pilimelia anulata]GGK09507.1 hypothetical protein GCM10010123_44240 [Pilimelia anulata]